MRKFAVGSLVLAVILGGAVWVSKQFFAEQPGFQAKGDAERQDRSAFAYTVTAEIGQIRVNGTSGFPNGVVLVGTLDKVGIGQIEVKEALVMNGRFTVEFGPQLYVEYYLRGMQEALQAGLYRLTIEFNPSQQSPFAQEALSRSPLLKLSPTLGGGSYEEDSATMRVAKLFTIGTAVEQRETQVREQQYQQMVRQHLSDTLRVLTNFWERLNTHYQDERSKGYFSRNDLRADDWQIWSSQWIGELKGFAAEAQLDETVASVLPYYPAREALVTVSRHIMVLPRLYFEVLTNDRPLGDRELQRTEQLAQYALGDAIAQLGQPPNMPLPAPVEGAKPTVVVLSPLVNVRGGPGIQYESIKQVKKDDVLDWLGERGEWFQVQLSGGRAGWVHRSVTSKRPQGDEATVDGKQGDAKPLNPVTRLYPQLEPISLLSTPVEFISAPTSDEVKIYGEMEQQLQNLQAMKSGERRAVEHHILQRMSDKYSLSPEQLWNTYLKVQGWQIRP